MTSFDDILLFPGSPIPVALTPGPDGIVSANTLGEEVLVDASSAADGQVIAKNSALTPPFEFVDVSMNVSATDKVIGRVSPGAGPAEEIDCTATGRSIIASASVEAAKQVLDVGNTDQSSVWFAHFITPVPNANGWNSGGSGAGNGYAAHWSTFITTTENAIGVVELKPGTAAGGYFGLFTGQDACKKGQARFVFEARLGVLALSGGAETYRIHFGLGTSQFSATVPAQFIGFTYYPDSYGDHRWRAITNDGTANTIDTGVALVATTMQTLRVELNEAGTEATFYIDGTLVGTSTTHITTGRFGPFIKIVKIASAGADTPLCVDCTRFSPTRSSAP